MFWSPTLNSWSSVYFHSLEVSPVGLEMRMLLTNSSGNARATAIALSSSEIARAMTSDLSSTLLVRQVWLLPCRCSAHFDI